MSRYPYGRIDKLAQSLEEAGVECTLSAEIMAGGEAITQKSSAKAKADWFRAAMLRMNQNLDYDTRRAVREACACCLGGKRLALVKEINKRGGTLEERVAAANETKYVFGNGVSLEPDGKIIVRFAPDDSQENRCVCLGKEAGTIAGTYCLCCGGHIKHHLQIALGRELVMNLRSSALASGGKRPCSFIFKIVH
jgi:hypothetical protein